MTSEQRYWEHEARQEAGRLADELADRLILAAEDAVPAGDEHLYFCSVCGGVLTYLGMTGTHTLACRCRNCGFDQFRTVER